MASNETQPPNIFAYRGRYLLQRYNDINNKYPNYKVQELAQAVSQPDAPQKPVCIIGAGAAGLYAAMIFDSLGIDYQIVEANAIDRVGGRLFTYRFPGGDYDYIDLGATKFRDTSFMKRTFNLIRDRDLQGLKLIPYINEMVNPPNTWLYFNGARVNNRTASDPIAGDPFNLGTYLNDKTLGTQEAVLNKVAEVIRPFRELFRSTCGQPPRDIATSMKALFEATNTSSTRTWMLSAAKMDPKDVNWCEALDSPTGTYDLALSQYVIESLAVNWPTTPLPGPEQPKDENEGWYCLDGGSSTLPRAMFDSLSLVARKKFLFDSPVTAISLEHEKVESGNVPVVKISINGAQHKEGYSAVISTVPLPCLETMDLSGVNINEKYAQWSALRALSYGPALKVGLRFTDAWWEKLTQPIHGGQSYTDLPLRTIVYPSYPEEGTKSNVLVVSYARLQDAQRLTALINSDGTAKPRLLDMIFYDLAAVHGVEVDYIKKYYQNRKENFFAWDWAQDPFAMGYAYFSPGVYGNGDAYSALLEPAAQGRLFFAGDAASAAHAWVEGSLHSAWRAVWQYLKLHDPANLESFYDKWGKTEYWDEGSDSIELYRDLMGRHLAIALQKDGITPVSK